MARPKPNKPKKPTKTVLLAGFSDVPDAKVMMAHYEVPASLAKCAFFFTRAGQAKWFWKKHEEKKIPAKVAQAGFHYVRALMDDERIRARLGGDADLGYHADLDVAAVKQAFEDEGFRVEKYEIPPLVSIMYSPADPWPAALALLKSGEIETGALVDALYTHDNLTPPPEPVMSLIAKSVDDIGKLRLMLTSAKADLVASALPLVAKLWKPKKAKARPRGLPPELTTLLSAFDGIPALGVMNAEQIAQRRKRLRQIGKDAKGVGKRDWGTTPKEIRIDKFWRDGWMPFCTRPDDETLAIDLEPSAQGTKGQIIGVHLNPPTLRRYRNTLGEWLWNELETAWR